MNDPRRPWTLPQPRASHAMAAGAVLLALFVRVKVAPSLFEQVTFFPFFAAVLLASWIGGLWPGVLATVLSIAASALFVTAPSARAGGASVVDLVQLLLFTTLALSITLVCESLHRARRRAHGCEAQARLAAIVESSDDAIISRSLDGTILSWNDGAQRLFGYRPDEIIGKPVTLLIPPDRLTEETVIAERLASGENYDRSETVRVARDGRAIDVSVTASPVKDASGRVVGSSKIIRDITDRKRSQESLLESEARFRAMADSIPHLAWIARGDGHIDWYNRRWYAYTGTTPEQVLGWGWHSVHDTGLLPDVMRRWTTAIAAGEPFEMVTPLKGANGRFLVFLTRAWPVRDSNGRVIQWFGTNTDIDALDRTERALRDSEQHMRLATEATAVGIWEWNVRSGQLRWDAAMFRIYGMAPTADGLLNYETWRQAVRAEDLPGQDAAMHELLRSRGSSRREFRITRFEDGALRHVQSVETARADAGGPVDWVVGTNLDVTEQRLAEESLRQVAARLAEVDRRKDEFLATLAHELRAPLAPISYGLQIIRLSAGDPNTVEQARSMVERQLALLVRLVDDLLDISRIGQQKLRLKKQCIELATVLRQAVETIRPLIDSGGLELDLNMPPEAAPVNGDSTRLTQVFANLINNAAKFSEPGGRIGVTMRRQGDEVRVSVSDHGLGILPHMLPRIYDMYTQADRSLDRSQGGLGIGLALVKHLVEMHGGSVQAHSEGPGRGSEFTVRLPLASGAIDESQPPVHSAHGGAAAEHRRILVADDSADSASSMAMLFELMGHEVRIARDGLQAVDVASTFQPDVVIMDIGMPRLGGLDACRRMREQAWSRDAVLVALTGRGQSDDRRRSLEAGFDHHLVKPVDLAVLETVLASLKAAPCSVLGAL